MNDSGVQDNAVAALVDQFGRASLVVIFGVLASWVLIKRDGAGPLSDLPDLGVPVVDAARPAVAQSTESLLDRAELAFAAGRVVDPEYDNALAFYKALKDQDPGNAEAEAGIERVIGFLLSQGEGAIYRGDWAAARSYATTADGIAAGHTGAQSLKARAEQLGQGQHVDRARAGTVLRGATDDTSRQQRIGNVQGDSEARPAKRHCERRGSLRWPNGSSPTRSRR